MEGRWRLSSLIASMMSYFTDSYLPHSYDYHQSVINNAREAEKAKPGRPLAIALDTVSGLARPAIYHAANIPVPNRKVLRSEPVTWSTM